MIERNSASVLVCVWTLGAFHVERRTKDGTWETVPLDEWGGNTHSRRLLKLLLCHERKARRGTIMEELWSRNESMLAEEYLNKAASNLRRVLHTEEQSSLLKTTNNRTTYELANQSHLWVDAKACESLMQEAEQVGHTTAQGLDLLKTASTYFERGRFLEDEQGLWCYGKRGVVDTARYRCTLWLAEAYERQGELQRAEEQVEKLLKEEPTDESALCRLMRLLHQQGMTSEAIHRYKQTKRLVEYQEGHLSPATDAFAKRLLNEQRPIELSVSTLCTEGHEVRNRLETVQKTGATDSALFTTSHTQFSHLLHNEEILSICATHIPICWRLYFDGQFSEVQKPLFSAYLPQLTILVHETEYQERAAYLASKASQLATLIEMHHQNLGNALAYTKQGVLYGKLAKDPNLQIAALIQQGNIYFNLKQPWKELEVYQQAHIICQEAKQRSEVSPLLEGRVYIGLAKSYGKLKDEQKALSFLESAYKRYPERPEDDFAFSYTCHTRFTLNNHTGLTYLNLGRLKSAWDIFVGLDKTLPTKLVPRRMELLVRQATISFVLGNMEESTVFLELAVASAIALGSNLRFNESYELYLLMAEKWGNEQQVKALGNHFSIPT
jgi:DNA-binding SARP family transcriptional activator